MSVVGTHWRVDPSEKVSPVVGARRTADTQNVNMSTNGPHPQNSCDGSQQPRFRNFGSDTPAVTSVSRVSGFVVVTIDLGVLIDGLPDTARASVRHDGDRLEVQRRNAWTMSIAGTEATIIDVDHQLPERVPDWLEAVCEVVGVSEVQLGADSQLGHGPMTRATSSGASQIADNKTPVEDNEIQFSPE